MKKIFITLVIVKYSPLYAQWTSSGTVIYNSNTGNIGIGITNPSYALTVNSESNSGSASSALHGQYFRSVIGVEQISSSYYALNVTKGATANIPGIGTSILYARAYSNIGIGTTSPGQKLEVAGNVAINGTNGLILNTSRGGAIDNQTGNLFLQKQMVQGSYLEILLLHIKNI